MENSMKIHRSVLQIMTAILRYGGIWSHTEESSTPKRIIFSAYRLFINSCMWIYALTITADLLLNFSNLLIAIEDSCMLAGVYLIVFKTTIFHIHRKRIISLMHRTYQPVDFLIKSSEPLVYVLIKNYVYYEKALEYSFVIGGAFLGSTFILQNPIVNGSLPIRAQYPFDTTVQPGHNVALLTQSIGVSAALYSIAGTDGITRSLCRYISFQLEILNINFQRCLTKWPCSTFDATGQKLSPKNYASDSNCFILFHPNETNINSKLFLDRFKLCIHHHQRLIKIVDDLNHVIGSSLLMQMLTSTLMICLTGFQALLLTSNSADMVGFILYLAVSFIHIATWCWFGHLLIHQSKKLTDSIWFSGWEQKLSSHTNYLVYVTLNQAKQVLSLKVQHLWALSMETFVSILKTSYSVFALLAAVLDKTVDE